jgi:hypothetical protein
MLFWNLEVPKHLIPTVRSQLVFCFVCLYAFLISPMHTTYPSHPIFGEEFKLWSSSLWHFIQPPVTSSLLCLNVLFFNLCYSLGDIWFESWTGDCLFWMRYFMFSLVIPERWWHSTVKLATTTSYPVHCISPYVCFLSFIVNLMFSRKRECACACL